MKNIKLLVLLTASVAAGSAFADCVTPTTPLEALQCINTSLQSRISDVRNNGNEVFDYNKQLVLDAYANYNTVKAIKQASNYGYYAATTYPKGAKSIANAVTAKDFDKAQAEYEKLKTARRTSFADGSMNGAAYAALLAEAKLAAKLQKVGTEREMVAVNYALDQRAAATAVEAMFSVYSFVTQDVVNYSTAAYNTMDENVCKASLQDFQTTFADLEEKDPRIGILLMAGAPGSSFKTIMQFAGAGVIDAVNSVYTFATGMSATVKNTPYNVCDYSQFKVNANNNVYNKAISNTIDKVVAKTHGQVTADKVYYAITAATAMGLDKALNGKEINLSAGSGISPYGK